MKKILIGLGVVVVIIIGVMVALPALVPLDRIKAEAVTAVKEATGRDLTFKDLSVSVFPSLAVTVSDVSLSNPPGFATTPMVHLAQLDASLKVMPLLGGRLEVDRFILDSPTVALEVNAAGKNNWTFEGTKAAAETAAAATPDAAKSSSKGDNLLKDLLLEDIKITNGTFTLNDAKTKSTVQIQKIGLDIGMKGLDQPLKLNGTVTWQGREIQLNTTVDKPRAVLDAGTTKLSTDLAVQGLMKLTFAGQVNVSTTAADGTVDLSAPMLRDLLAWVSGAPVALPPNTFGPLALKGTVSGSPAKVAVSNVDLSLDQIKGKGDLSVALNQAVPDITAHLSTNVLDLNPYMASGGGAAGSGGGTGGGGNAAPKSAGWSTDPIDLSGLKAVNAALTLNVDGLLVEKITVGKSALQVTLRNGVLTTNLSEMAFYQGQGRAKVVLNASQPKLGVDLDASLKGMAIEPFLKDMANFGNLTGTGAVEIKIAGTGSNQKQIVQTLNGHAALTFTNGAIKGIDLASMIQNVASAFGVTNSQGQKTEFTKMGGTFTIVNGIATNKDFVLESPVIQANAAGTINLPDQTLNYRVTPQVVSGAGSLSVPVLVSGPWSNLTWAPDLAAIAAQQGKRLLNDALKGQIPGLGGGTSGGSGSGSGGANPLQNIEKDIGKGLGGLFGR